MTVRGAPIGLGLSVPREAPHRAIGERFAVYLLAGEGRDVLRRAGVDLLDRPVVVGEGAPAVQGDLRP